MNHQTVGRKQIPGKGSAAAQSDEIQEIMLVKHIDGAILGALFGALAGALLGAFLGWLLGGTAWKMGEKWFGGDEANFAGEIGAVLGGVIAMVLSQQLSVRPFRDTLLWALIGIEVWLVVRLVGGLVLGWEIAGTGFSWATGGLIIGLLGGSRGLAAHFAGGDMMSLSDRPKDEIVMNREITGDSLDWIGNLVRKVFPGGRAAAFGAAAAGAIGGAAGGWVYGVFTGDLGKAIIGGPLGALIGAAILGAVGGGTGAYLAIREYERPRRHAKDDANDPPLVETVS
jgi:hypothetical protein